MTELYLIRHGQTVYNVAERVQGNADSPLTEAGRADASALGRGLMKAGVVFDAAYASDLSRAQATAQLALDAADQYLPLQADCDLREENYGRFEGHPQEQRAEALATLLPEADITKLVPIANTVHQLDPEGEDAQTVQLRFDKALRRIAEAESGRVMVVAHGTVILLWLAYIGYPLHGQNRMNNAAVTRVTFADGKFAVHEFDSLAYVEAGRA